MSNVDELSEKIKIQIIEAYKKLKRDLFESNGTILERDWEDLTPRYKKYKAKKIGSAYPINILTGELLKQVLDNALTVEVFYDSHFDKMNFKIDINSDKIGLSYANHVNNKREYISFSMEEKKIITGLVAETVKNYFEGALQ